MIYVPSERQEAALTAVGVLSGVSLTEWSAHSCYVNCPGDLADSMLSKSGTQGRGRALAVAAAIIVFALATFIRESGK